MKSLIFTSTILALLFLFSCRNNKDILSENVERMYADYDVYTPNNLGNPFAGTIGVDLRSGETIELKNNKGFSSSENFSAEVKDRQLNVYGPLPNYTVSKVPVTLNFVDKKDVSISFQDTILLNFRSNSRSWYNGANGAAGSSGNDGNTPLLFRNGNDGEMGAPGQSGENGQELEIYVWAKSDTLMIYVWNPVFKTGDRYKLVGAEAKFYLDASGGRGGAGGKGGDGGKGKNGEVKSNSSKLPGYGGRGGNGGFGGRGGNGGRITVNVHPSATDIEMRFVIDVDGGIGGNGGDSGTGGKGGTAATGQTDGINGVNGVKGIDGGPGANGWVSFITRDFDFSNY